MKIDLFERMVKSSWLEDISYYGRRNKLYPGEEIITFKVKNNSKIYVVRGLTRQDYKDWINSSSKGKLFHVLKHRFNRDWYFYPPFQPIPGTKVTPKGAYWSQSKRNRGQ